MKHKIVLCSILITISSFAFAQLDPVEWTIRAKHEQRSVDVTNLIQDASEKYPDLAQLKLESRRDEVEALRVLGHYLTSELPKSSSVEELEKRVSHLEEPSSEVDREIELEELKRIIKLVATELDESLKKIRELAPLAERAYKLQKLYDSPSWDREDWFETWRQVKRLVPYPL